MLRSHADRPWYVSNETSENNQKAKDAYGALKMISLRRSSKAEYAQFEARVKKQAEERYNYRRVTGEEYKVVRTSRSSTIGSPPCPQTNSNPPRSPGF